MNMDLQSELEKALAHDELGEIPEAVACLDRIAGEVPREADFQKFVGMLYQRLGEDRKSIPFILAALELAPMDDELHLALGFHSMDNALLTEAAESFGQALNLDPSSQTAQLFLGRTLDFLGDLESAEESLIKAIAFGPEEPEPHFQLARVLLRQGKLDQAMRKFDQLEEISPGHRMAELGSKRVAALRENRVAIASSRERESATIVCVKQGAKYGPDYVNCLKSMIGRHTSEMPRLICFTDEATGIEPGVEIHDLPDPEFKGWWNKVSLFHARENLPDVGDRMLYFDLDVVLTGNIDRLLTYDSDFAIMDNDYVPGFNTSVFLLKTGSRPEIRTEFTAQIADEYDGDQDWVATMAPDGELWPAMWCVPYRLRAAQQPPPDTKVVVFSGRPNPADHPSGWVTEYWR